MMHSQLTEEQQRAAGADPSILRMTIGIEDDKDIIADLDQALHKAREHKAVQLQGQTSRGNENLLQEVLPSSM